MLDDAAELACRPTVAFAIKLAWEPAEAEVEATPRAGAYEEGTTFRVLGIVAEVRVVVEAELSGRGVVADGGTVVEGVEAVVDDRGTATVPGCHIAAAHTTKTKSFVREKQRKLSFVHICRSEKK